MPKQTPAVSLLFFMLLLCATKTTAQHTGKFVKKNTLYAEGAANDPVYSINLDHIFSEGSVFTKSYRAGFSVYNNVLAFPLGINFFTGKNAHHAELGATVIPYIEKYQKLFAAGNQSDKKLYIIGGAGYRYQQPTGGFFFKAIAGPELYLDPPSDDFWNMAPSLHASFSISAGFSF